MTDHQAHAKQTREQLLSQWFELRKKYSGNQAARILGESHATLSRWVRDGVVPRQAGNCGGKPKFDLNEDEQDALRHCRLAKDSLPLAIEDFLQTPECRPETRAKIFAEMDAAARERRLPCWPMSLKRAGYVSDDLKGEFRGKKHAQEFELIECRGMWFVDERGNRLPVVSNTLFESDDMSVNEPFRYPDPETGFIQVGRQTLCTMDVHDAAWLGVSPVGRVRDAYRLEDIADHLCDTVREHGVPLIWRFERGPWENQVIDGIKLGDGTRWGGLDHLFRVLHVFKSRSKGLIETSFDLLQSLTAHQSLTIGRSRSEFERETKLFLAAGRGDVSAAGNFWEIAAAADGIAAAMLRFNERPKNRRAFGRQAVVPNDLRRDAARRECPASELWRFSPIKRTATVRGGAIEVSVEHYPLPFRFRVNGVDPEIYFERGYQVLIAFHPGRPEEGCHVFNAERGARNRDGLRFGEKMILAPFAEDAPQLNLRPDEREFVARKNSKAAVRSEFRAIVGAGIRGSRVSTARDGWGNSATTLQVAGCGQQSPCGLRANPVPPLPGGTEEPPGDLGHESPGPAIHFSRRQSASPAPDFDEEAELKRIAHLERAAIERGDILVT